MTLRHVVAWKLATDDAGARAEQARRISEDLMALRDRVPSILDIRVGPDVVGAGNWDIALVADFADEDALNDYVHHPDHQAVVAYVRSVVSDRVAVDFEV